tara:strand:+ start:536 stop:718 length:183 start_codon:yes stop_codon:yes gene_type:complete
MNSARALAGCIEGDLLPLTPQTSCSSCRQSASSEAAVCQSRQEAAAEQMSRVDEHAKMAV